MKSFEDGWLPTGWERGDRIRVVNANFARGSQMAFHNLDALMGPPTADICELCSIRFHYDDAARVLRWLRWFYVYPEGDPRLFKQISDQITPCR